MKRISLLLAMFILAACGGSRSEKERAIHLLASGNPGDATAAVEILEGLLESASGDDKLEIAELYSGALLSQAGFNGVSLIVNVLHRGDENVAATLRNVIDDVEGGLGIVGTAVSSLEEIVGTLHNESGDSVINLEPTVRDDEEDAYGFSSIEPSSDYTNADAELKKRMNYALGVANLYRGLYILLKTTGFDASDDFDRDECQTFLTGASVGDEGVDSISLSFFRARAYFARASYDDRRLGNSKNNKIIKLIDDGQTGSGGTAIDADRDGFIGDASDGEQDADAKASIVCQYLDESLN